MKNVSDKHIDVIMKYFYPVAAGIETNVLETYSVLVEKGWTVTIHTSKDTLTEKNVLPDTDNIKGLKIMRYKWSIFGFIPKINPDSTTLICLHNFNITPHFFIMLQALSLKLIGKKKYALILTPHGGFNPEWSVFPRLSGLIKKIYHFTIGTLLINLAVDSVRAVSDWEGNEIASKGVQKKKIKVIPNGVEDEAYKNVDKLVSRKTKELVEGFGKYIIQVGRVYPIKNYETTIKTLPKIDKDVKFVIIGPLDYVMGKATYKENLEKLSKELGVEDRVIFGGVLRGVDKYYVIKHAQMMVHMALWESFCNVVHEGLSQGLVCIVANNTALPYLIKDKVNGYCIETRDSNALSQKIQFVLDNKKREIITDMEKRNRKYGLENSWRNVAVVVDELYSKLSQSQ